MKKIILLAVIAVLLFGPYKIDLSIKKDTAEAYYNISGGWNITGSTFWSADMGTIMINWRSVVVQPGAKLTIEPGTVVKAGGNLGIWVYGELEIAGAEDDPVIITSYCDNDYGENGYVCQPDRDKNIFGGIRTMDGGRTTINHAIIRYGGEMAPIDTLSKNSENIARAGYGYGIFGALSVYNGILNIQDTTIEKNLLGIGTAGDDCRIEVANSRIAGNEFGAKGECANPIQAQNNWWGSETGPWHEMQNSDGQGDRITGNIEYDPWIGKLKARDPVLLIPGLMGSWNISGRWELDPIFHTYDDLWTALKMAGYEEGKTLFAFPYQWRFANGYTAMLLKEKINEIKAVCGCQKVDLVAHSMGGLVARAYVQGREYDNDVDQLIFSATPHKGAPKAYLTWEGGELGIDLKDEIMERIFALEAEANGYSSLYEYVRGLPMQSIHDLLPVYDYLRDHNSARLREYPDSYPVNNFLFLLNQPEQLERLQGIRMINMVADSGENSTLNSIRVVDFYSNDGKWEHGCPENYWLPLSDHGLEYGFGDGTVPLTSNADFFSSKIVKISSDHAGIITESQKAIIQELTGNEPDKEIRSNIAEKFLLIRIFSPADFSITSPEGRKIGMDDDGAQVNQISGAFYYNEGYEFAIIPEPQGGKYIIGLTGTDKGKYKLSVSLFNGDGIKESEHEGQIAEYGKQDFSLIIDETAEDTGKIIPIDSIPPAIEIFSPESGKEYGDSQTIKIDFAASDDFSGIEKIETTLDGQKIDSNEIDPWLLNFGQHIFNIEAWDKSGNYSTGSINFILVADIDGTIKNIIKLHELGEITTEHAKHTLVNRFLALRSIDNSAKANELNDNNKAIVRYLLSIGNYTEILLRNGAIRHGGYGIILKDINYLIEFL